MQTRRSFLKRSTDAAGAVVLLAAIPPWVKKGISHRTVFRERSFYTMGSVATITAYGESMQEIDEAINGVMNEFGRMDALLSVFNPKSFISKVNAAAGTEDLAVSPEVLELFMSARRFSELTAGAFDVTVEPLMRRWGFRDEKRELERIPSDRELADLVSALGYRNVAIDEAGQRIGLKHPRAAIDMGGIAVGWTIDRAVSQLRRKGITAAFINHSGDAYALGIPEESDGWVVGIPDPNHPDEIMRTLTLRDEAIATSGNYQNHVRIGLQQFGHLMDPRTGRPESKILSMSIVAQSALEADALSTGLACLGIGENASSFQPVRAIWVERQGEGFAMKEMTNRTSRK